MIVDTLCYPFDSMWLICVFAFSIQTIQSSSQIRWSVTEEKPIGTYVGTLKGQGSDLVHSIITAQIYRNNKILKKNRFSKLISKAKYLFEIEANSGNKLLTANRVDREELCGESQFISQCGVILEVSIDRLKFWRLFELINLSNFYNYPSTSTFKHSNITVSSYKLYPSEHDR